MITAWDEIGRHPPTVADVIVTDGTEVMCVDIEFTHQYVVFSPLEPVDIGEETDAVANHERTAEGL